MEVRNTFKIKRFHGLYVTQLSVVSVVFGNVRCYSILFFDILSRFFAIRDQTCKVRKNSGPHDGSPEVLRFYKQSFGVIYQMMSVSAYLHDASFGTSVISRLSDILVSLLALLVLRINRQL